METLHSMKNGFFSEVADKGGWCKTWTGLDSSLILIEVCNRVGLKPGT